MNLKPIAIGAAVGFGVFALCVTARDKLTRREFNQKYEAFKCGGSDTYRAVFANATDAFMFGGTDPSSGRRAGAILLYNSNEADELVRAIDQWDLSDAPIEDVARICQAFVLSTMKV